ncbi:hypothetical protein HDU98_005472 [Podochytrium sp. JEL0797]|nr:hypothetical protein HDU98_005472 [Podochytrium sp. JEL0797]
MQVSFGPMLPSRLFLIANRSSGFSFPSNSAPARRFASTPNAATPSPDDSIAKAQEWFTKGMERWDAGDLDGARSAFEESAKQHPTSDNFYNLGNCLYSLGKNDEAIESWQQCIGLEPSHIDAHVNLANVYAISKSPEKAIGHYKIANEINPMDGEVQYNYGAVLDSMGKLEEAIDMYENSVANGVSLGEKNLRNARERLAGKKAAGTL